MNKHVVLIEPSLGGGSAERVMADMSRILHKLRKRVTLITAYDDVDCNYSGNHISLGLVKGSPFLLFQAILAFFRWRILMKQLSPHVIIDSRARGSPIRELLIHLIIYNKVF